MGVLPLEGRLVFVIQMETGFCASVQVCCSVWWEGGLEEAGSPGWLFWSVWEKAAWFPGMVDRPKAHAGCAVLAAAGR